jgi:hypothetical protein
MTKDQQLADMRRDLELTRLELEDAMNSGADDRALDLESDVRAIESEIADLEKRDA